MDKKFLLLVAIFFFSFSLFASLMIMNKPISKLTRAKEELIPSAEKSLIFAWPMTAPADGKTKVSINVFIRNKNSLPLSNKKVSLTASLGEIEEIQPISDKNGKTQFYLNSNQTGISEIKATVDNQIELIKRLTIKFE